VTKTPKGTRRDAAVPPGTPDHTYPDHTYRALGQKPPRRKVRASQPPSLTSDAVTTDPSQVPAVPGAVFYILPPLDAGPPFGIGTTITICEAAMVYGGRHPHGGLLRDWPLVDCEDFIRTSSTSWHAYCDLMRRAKDRSLKLAKPFWLPDGRLDPRQTRIETDALYRLAQERGDADPMVALLAQCAASLAREAAAADSGEAQHRCEQWLRSLPPTPVRRKPDVWDEARRQPFGGALSDRAFLRAWKEAAPRDWKKKGSKVGLPR
jgi:hypothetical protein